MKLQLRGWRAKNLRGYLREVSIDLPREPNRWNLVQMPNGTGKTTTMALLRSSLNGSRLSNEEIMSFRADDTVSDGRFECLFDIDSEPHEIRMLFDFREPVLTYQTLIPSEKSGGLREGHHLPATLRDTLRAGVTELFVFDGELAATIISSNAKRADEAIQTLYRLDTLGDLVTDISRQVEQRRRSARSTRISTPTRIASLQADYDEAKGVYALLQASERKLRKDLENSKHEIASIDDELASIARTTEEFREEQANIEGEQKDIRADIRTLGPDVLRLFRSPPQVGEPFRQSLESLGGTLEQKKLPRSMSREFFEQLASADKCICGRPLSKHERQEIQDHLEDYLGQDEIAVINRMKSRLHAIRPDEDTFTHRIAVLSDQLGALRLCEQREERLRQRMKEEGLDVVAELEERREEVDRRRILSQDALERLTSDPGYRTGDWRNNLPACARELTERRKRLATAEGTYEFRQKADRLSTIVNDVQTLALRRLRDRIRDRTNTNLATVLVNEIIQIEAIHGHLRLTGEAAIRKDSVSEGQKLAVAYAFLAALLADAHHQFPLIVDSPAVSLDIQLRRTVGGLIQPLFEQMVMFVISSEREGFADAFYDKEEAKFLTVSLDSVTGRTTVAEGISAFRAFQSNHASMQ